MLQAVKEVRKLSNSDLEAVRQVKPDLSKYKDILSSVSFVAWKLGLPNLNANVKTNVLNSIGNNNTENSTVNNDFKFQDTVNESGNPHKAVDLMYKQSVNGLKPKFQYEINKFISVLRSGNTLFCLFLDLDIG
ncbi:hypothetical protein BB65665_16383 [Bacillus sp. 916]|nr:hypothetical protein KO64_14300 [Bacillus subtilis]EJD66449.1 hypothetical protein BB65665_16383 [Bacillus sp. 916]